MSYSSFRSIALAAVAGTFLAAAPASAQTLNLTLAGASPGGLWTLLGAGLDAALKKGSPDSNVTYQTSGGGFANAAMLSRGQAEIGLVHDAELSIAVAGKPPFREPIENLRAIGYLYDWAPMQFVTTKAFADEHGIETLGDLAEMDAPVRITVNRAGNITGEVAMEMLKAAGADEAKIEAAGGSVIRAGSSEGSGLLQNGRVDVYTNGIFVGHSSIRELENALDIKLLSVPEDVRRAVETEFAIGDFAIPADSYENQPAPIETVALGAVLVASTNMSDDDAYVLTKALVDNIDAVRSVHPAMGALDVELLTRETAIPFHDGALKAYREAGLMD